MTTDVSRWIDNLCWFLEFNRLCWTRTETMRLTKIIEACPKGIFV